MTTLQKKIKSRDLHATNLHKLFSKVEEIYKDYEEEKLEELLATLEIAEMKYSKVSELNSEVEAALEGDDQEEMSEKGMSLEIELKTKISRLKRFIKEHSMPIQSPKSEKVSTKSSNVKLPRLEIMKFNGEFTKWQTFYDSFEAAVEKNQSLSNIEKFNYLRSYLGNDAYNCIAGLSLTNENYIQALDLLKERYGNKQKIITSHVNELLEMDICGNDTKKIRQFYDNIESHVRSLQGIGVDGKEYGTVLAPVIMNKMPGEFRLAISRGLSETNEWDLTKLLDLMQRELRARETCASDQRDGKREFYTGSGLHVNQRRQSSISQKPGLSCVFCRGNHWSDKCGVVSDPTARKEHLKKNKLCFLCLRGGHDSRSCKKTKTCFYCKGFHNSSICLQRDKKEDSPSVQPNDSTTTKITSGHVQQNSCVLLQTADVTLKNTNNASREVRVKLLLDPGSQRTYVTERVKNILNLPVKGTEKLEISVFGNKQTSNRIASNVELSIASSSNAQAIPIQALTVPFICLPVRNQPLEAAKGHFENLNLNFADSGLDDEIDLLVGLDYFWELVTGKLHQGKEPGLVAMETKIGWVISGPIAIDAAHKNFSSSHLTHTMKIAAQPIDDDNLQTLVERFWDLESLGISETEKSPWEESLEEKITRNADNRYEIELPFKHNHPILPDNYETSKNRLLKLREKLLKDPESCQTYVDVLEGHRNMGIIETAPDDCKVGETHYLPHHGVMKEESSTTKLRVVFDASAKSKKNVPSLNDCLMKGSNYTPLLYDILLRFRTKAIALTADIAKAFYMISIAENDRDYLRFLWFDNIFADQPRIIRNRFARLVMGVTSSPAVLNATIRKHVETYEFDEQFIKEVLDSFYVDDFVGGAESIEKAIELLKKLKLRFMEAHFYLRKWKTNNPDLQKFINELSTHEMNETKEETSTHSNKTAKATQGITKNQNKLLTTIEEERESKDEKNNTTKRRNQPCTTKKENTEKDFNKTLGIVWDNEKDVFLFDFSQLVQEGEELEPTKRNVLKFLSSFYDPIGLIQPIIISLKILMQRICKQKLDWDETLPKDLLEEWKLVLNSLKSIGKLPVNRRLESLNDIVVSRELHGFCDASKQGYGATVYNKSTYKSGEIETNLITSKTRVAPIKGPTLPRLELLSTLLLTRLMNSVESALSDSFPFDRKRYWNDSQIALAWIEATHKEFKPFVENRLKDIRKHSKPDEWGYVKSEMNPADVITRFNEQSMSFNENMLWWKGPLFLRQDEHYDGSYDKPTDLPEEKVNFVNMAHAKTRCHVNLDNVIEIERFSSNSRLYRVTAWVRRFIGNLFKSRRNETLILSPILSPLELREAEQQWLHTNQIEFFNDTSNDLQRKLSEHGVTLDHDDGLLKCHGRLHEAPLPYETRKPVLLNPRHRLTQLIVTNIHRTLKHVSAKQTLTELRQRFWIFKGRSFVRTTLRNCTRCRLFNSKPYRYPAAPPLLKLRLQDNHPFSTTGVDNFGPLYVKEVFPNRNRLFKAWVALYTCASSRAILLDLVPDIGSTSFIRSFRRMIARRGCPNNVISDNGSNFISTETQTFITSLGVDWDLNIPLAPWHGGFFERMVKSSKELLRKALLNNRLTFEEMQTVLAEVEQILNNRPLTYAYPNDLECCLTPNHLLFGRNLPYTSNEKSPIDLHFDEASADRVTTTIQHFWERWRKEYVVNLRETQKLTVQNKLQPSPAVGDIVIIHEDKLPRSMWRLGKIEELLKGQRGAVVLTQKSRLTRPVNLLYPIEYVRNDVKVSNNEQIEQNAIVDTEIPIIDTRPRRDAAVRGELKRKFFT